MAYLSHPKQLKRTFAESQPPYSACVPIMTQTESFFRSNKPVKFPLSLLFLPAATDAINNHISTNNEVSVFSLTVGLKFFRLPCPGQSTSWGPNPFIGLTVHYWAESLSPLSSCFHPLHPIKS